MVNGSSLSTMQCIKAAAVGDLARRKSNFQNLARDRGKRSATLLLSSPPYPPQKNKHLRRKACARVESHVLPSSGPRRDKALVPLVETGYERGPQKSDGSPPQRPIRIVHRGQSCAPRAKKQDAQDGVADDVPSLAHVEVPILKAFPVEAEQKMQQRKKNSACIMSREQRAGFDGDDDQPENRRDPGLQ
jgi:hypothetical protein